MKSLFVTSLSSAILSLLAILTLSAMTVVPTPGAESWRTRMMLLVLAFFIGWLCVAVWARPGRQAVLPPKWLRRALVVLGATYSLWILFAVVG